MIDHTHQLGQILFRPGRVDMDSVSIPWGPEKLSVSTAPGRDKFSAEPVEAAVLELFSHPFPAPPPPPSSLRGGGRGERGRGRKLTIYASSGSIRSPFWNRRVDRQPAKRVPHQTVGGRGRQSIFDQDFIGSAGFVFGPGVRYGCVFRPQGAKQPSISTSPGREKAGQASG